MSQTRTRPEELKGCIEDYLRQRGLSLRKPFHCLSPDHADRNPSMSYHPQAGNVHCFACGATYDIFDLIGMDYGLSGFPERLDKVCELFGYSAPLPRVSLELEPSTPPSGQMILTDRSGQLAEIRSNAEEDYGYFRERGIAPEYCEKYGLFQQGGRAYFPVEEGGVCTGWCARAISDDLTPRYKNSPGALGIWNGDLLHQNGNGRRLFVTEGILDALCIEQMGEHALSLCGSQNTAKLLRRCEASLQTANGWRFVSCGDPDPAGEKMNADLASGLEKLGISCTVLPLESGDGDVQNLYRRDAPRLAKLMAETSIQTVEYAATAAACALDDFFSAAARRADEGVPSTGFPGLDRLLDGGLHPGLYVIGAISSLGKTSLVLQIADHLAGNGEDVLFFSLEQSRYELMAKSLSRTSARLDGARRRDAFTARQLLSGRPPATLQGRLLLDNSRAAYARAASALFIREGVADIGVGEIRADVREHMAHRGRAPVVMVDYLQILRPADGRATDKQNTDRAVVELKRISRDFDIPVVAVSSFNRENYRSAVSMEAFKESGAVEYSADVLLGMQLQGAGGKDFDANSEKARDPRRIELVLLKNRNGIPYAKVNMRYHAKFSLFEEANPGTRGGQAACVT